MTRLVVVGDALLDRDVVGVVERLSPEAPVPVVEALAAHARPGGAALAAALAAGEGAETTLVTALAADAAGRELARLLAAVGVDLVDTGLAGATPEKIRIRTADQMLLRVDHGDRTPAPAGPLPDRARAALHAADAVLVSDYGRGLAARPDLRRTLSRVRDRVVWDPHPRGRAPVPGVRLATPNRSETARLEPVGGGGLEAEADRAERLLERWRATALAVTLGREGALLVGHDAAPFHVPAPVVASGDTCGAGDRFAETAARSLAQGRSLLDAVESAVAAASAFVAAGGAVGFARRLSAPARRRDAHPRGGTAAELVARVRAAGGTVAATGGCFDLLHAGHVAMLEAARAHGDCLVVLLNSDASVARLKGADRPLVPEDDRVAVLEALAAVDAVVVFDEDTPAAALARLRPDVWVKGGDYTPDELPEARIVEAWGGRIVIVPYVVGRSTTRLIEEAQVRAGANAA